MIDGIEEETWVEVEVLTDMDFTEFYPSVVFDYSEDDEDKIREIINMYVVSIFFLVSQLVGVFFLVLAFKRILRERQYPSSGLSRIREIFNIIVFLFVGGWFTFTGISLMIVFIINHLG